MKRSELKPTLKMICAIITLTVGCGLLIAGFIVPPPGEIHNSVLIAFGEILTFVGTVWGMNTHYKYKDKSGIQKGLDDFDNSGNENS